MASKPDSTDNTNKTCPRCTDAATKVCGGCKNISYCSTECQQADWHAHKLLCKILKDFTHPPSPNMRRVIAFLPDEKKPRFAWAPVRSNFAGVDDEGKIKSYETIDETHITQVEQNSMAHDTDRNAWTGEPLGYAIGVLFDDNFNANYADRNKAVTAATQGMDELGWRGPLIAYRGKRRGGDFDALDIVKIHDMDMRAYSHLIAYLIDHCNETPKQRMRRGQKVQCVKVADSVERENSPIYQQVGVSPSHPMFLGQSVLSSISKVNMDNPNRLVGILLTRHFQQLQEPLITWPCPRNPKASRGPSNPEIVSLHVCCDPTIREDDNDIDTPSFGYPHKLLLLDVSTHIVARTSGQPLDCEIVDAMVDFCRFHLPPYFQRCWESEDFEDEDEEPDEYFESLKATSSSRMEHRQKVMDQITPQKWKTYFSQWKAEKAEKATKEAGGELVYTKEKARSGVERMGLTEEDSNRLTDILFNFSSLDFEMAKLKLPA
jgi:hypothetical protein